MGLVESTPVHEWRRAEDGNQSLPHLLDHIVWEDPEPDNPTVGTGPLCSLNRVAKSASTVLSTVCCAMAPARCTVESEPWGCAP